MFDRLVGYEVSPVLWRKIGRARGSAGRVQSVAVRLVVERERARMAFRSGQWSDLVATLAAATRASPRRSSSSTTCASRPATTLILRPDRSRAAARCSCSTTRRPSISRAALRDSHYTVDSVESSKLTEKPKPPFTTSTLQQEAAAQAPYGSAKTMAVAQRLYERGFITYMRTDSTNLSEQALSAARRQIVERLREGVPARRRRAPTAPR